MEYNIFVSNNIDWEVNPGDYENNGSFVSTVSIDGIETIDVNDVLGIFVDDECRGVAQFSDGSIKDYREQLDHIYFLPMVYSNEAEELMTIKYYDYSSNKIYELENYEFVSDMIVGSFSSPYNFNGTENILYPNKLSLNAAYPNPFNPVTHLDYGVPESININISVYDINGRTVEVLVDQIQDAGYYSVIWNGNGYPSGMYFIALSTNNQTKTQKVLLIK